MYNAEGRLAGMDLAIGLCKSGLFRGSVIASPFKRGDSSCIAADPDRTKPGTRFARTSAAMITQSPLSYLVTIRPSLVEMARQLATGKRGTSILRPARIEIAKLKALLRRRTGTPWRRSAGRPSPALSQRVDGCASGRLGASWPGWAGVGGFIAMSERRSPGREEGVHLPPVRFSSWGTAGDGPFGTARTSPLIRKDSGWQQEENNFPSHCGPPVIACLLSLKSLY
jgi:hypothetical protein